MSEYGFIKYKRKKRNNLTSISKHDSKEGFNIVYKKYDEDDGKIKDGESFYIEQQSIEYFKLQIADQIENLRKELLALNELESDIVAEKTKLGL